jgi:hypothetical protein
MQWEVRVREQILLAVGVSIESLLWIQSRVHDPDVAQLDPYGDSQLDGVGQERWRAALQRLEDDLREELEENITKTHRLPREPSVRRQIVDQLIGLQWRNHPHTSTLGDLRATLDLAYEAGATIHAWGD